jgi:hypothetical protein
LAVSLAVLAGVGSSAVAQEYYRQNPVNAAGGYSSQDARNTGGLGWFSEVADNFPGQAGWSINQLTFWGGYVSDPATPGNTRGFAIRFYADDDGRPGARLYEQDQMTFTRTEYYNSGPIPPTFPNGIAGYRYELSLPTAFDVPADGTYWLSVVAILDRGGGSREPQWGWVQTAGVTSPSGVQWFFSPGNFNPINTDMSFVLSREGPPPRCVADVDDGTGTGTPDGGVTIDDLLYYLVIYGDGNIAADVDNGTFTGVPDGGVTIDDLLYFLVRYGDGC